MDGVVRFFHFICVIITGLVKMDTESMDDAGTPVGMGHDACDTDDPFLSRDHTHLFIDAVDRKGSGGTAHPFTQEQSLGRAAASNRQKDALRKTVLRGTAWERSQS